MAKLNTLELCDKIYDSFPDKEARQAIEDISENILPNVTVDDDGKLLQVIDGKWNVTDVEIGGAADCAVLYTEQNLTEEQKAQVRANIGADITADEFLSHKSTNPVQNKVVAQAIADMQPVRFTVTKQGKKYVASKTCQELLDILAKDKHGAIICEFDGIDVPMSSLTSSNAIIFTTATSIWNSITVVFSNSTGVDAIVVYNDSHSITINGQLWDEEDPNADFTDTINDMIDQKVGEVETALDSIIALQQTLIGGDGE